MRYLCLACDYDGTIASQGSVPDEVTQALMRVGRSGRKLILATGRRLEDLFRVYPHVNLFDHVVCENGAVLYRPATGVSRSLVNPPPQKFIDLLIEKGVSPLEIGRVIVATWHPNETVVLQAIQELGLDLHITFNKGAVMVLPHGVSKGFGVNAALSELGLSRHNLVGVGDAENDHALLGVSEFGAAVANAVPMLKEAADVVLEQGHGVGVSQLVDLLVKTDLAEVENSEKRRSILLGTDGKEQEVRFNAYDYRILLIGPSKSGQSTAVNAVLDQFAATGYQYCVIDAEGEYDRAPKGVTIGNQHYAPDVDDVMRVLENPDDNAVVNIIGVPINERAAFLARIFTAIQEFRRVRGRPHWLVIDEAHHMLHSFWDHACELLWQDPGAVVLVSVDPAEVSKSVLAGVDLVIAAGKDVGHSFARFGEHVGEPVPTVEHNVLGWGQVLAWFRRENQVPMKLNLIASAAKKQRHRRKYADGNLGELRSFYFTGPQAKLHIRCQNLFLFILIGDGVDDETWLFHLRRHDYSKWFGEVIGDQELADEAKAVEEIHGASASDSRLRIKEVIEKRYTAPSHLVA